MACLKWAFVALVCLVFALAGHAQPDFTTTSLSEYRTKGGTATSTLTFTGYSESPLPTVVLSCPNMEGICLNTRDMIPKGQNSVTLMYDGDKKRNTRRRTSERVCGTARRAECAATGSCDPRFPPASGSSGRPEILEWRVSCDEFPLASTIQGGAGVGPNNVGGAGTKCVATREQNGQGLLQRGLARLISKNPASQGKTWARDNLVHPYVLQFVDKIPSAWAADSDLFAGLLIPGGATYNSPKPKAPGPRPRGFLPCLRTPAWNGQLVCPAFNSDAITKPAKRRAIGKSQYKLQGRTIDCPRTPAQSKCGGPSYRKRDLEDLAFNEPRFLRAPKSDVSALPRSPLEERQAQCEVESDIGSASGQAEAAAAEAAAAEEVLGELGTAGAAAAVVVAGRSAVAAMQSAASVASALAAGQTPVSAYIAAGAAAEAAWQAFTDAGDDADDGGDDWQSAADTLGEILGGAYWFWHDTGGVLNGTSAADEGALPTFSSSGGSLPPPITTGTGGSPTGGNPGQTSTGSVPSKTTAPTGTPTSQPGNPTTTPPSTSAPTPRIGRYESMQSRAIAEINDLYAINAKNPKGPTCTTSPHKRAVSTALPHNRQSRHGIIRVPNADHTPTVTSGKAIPIIAPGNQSLWEYLPELLRNPSGVFLRTDSDDTIHIVNTSLQHMTSVTRAFNHPLIKRQSQPCSALGCGGSPVASAQCALLVEGFSFAWLLACYHRKDLQCWEQTRVDGIPSTLRQTRSQALSALAPGNATAAAEWDDIISLWTQLAAHMHDADFFTT